MPMWIWTATGYRTGSRIELEFSESALEREFFVKQSAEEPVWQKVQPNVRTDAESMSAVVPGLKFLFGQKHSGGKLTGENKQSVEAAAQREAYPVGDAKQRAQKSRAAVDRKHPEGSVSLQLEIMPLQRLACSIKNFHTPSGDAAVEE